MTGKSFEELRVGDIGFIEKTISETDVYMYAGITGDFNWLHVNEVKASESCQWPFKNRHFWPRKVVN
ncbi:MAG TPA: MaoC/PaaZ C-terminal domain-containing protein [Acetivibrio sp.]|nr:MaoC/PaaZ C-terminal domain-containing protein [Acetivibrio sp.]